MSNDKQVTVSEQIKNTLGAMGPQFKSALPAHITPERFIRVAQTAILTNPSILDCERNSLYAACLKAAQDGLLPDGKEAALVPFKGKATYMPMVAGILKKCRNSGDLASIMSQIVYAKDSFRYWVDENGEHLAHSPDIMNPDRGEPSGVYALAKTKDGSTYIEVLTFEDIERIKSSSRSSDSGPWKTWPEEMAKKSAIRRLSKRLPMSTDLEDVIHRDDQYYDFKKDDTPKISSGAQTPRLEKLMQSKADVAVDIPKDEEGTV